MSNEVYAFALNNTLQEIQNICPEVASSFIFKDEKILAKTKKTEDKTAMQTLNVFKSITKATDALFGLEAVTIQGAKGKVNIAVLDNFTLTTVSSKEADDKYINTLTRVLIPVVTKLVDEIHSASTIYEPITKGEEALNMIESESVEDDVTEETVDELADDSINEVENIEYMQHEESERVDFEEVDAEPLLPEPPVTQLIIENLGGFLVPSDTVRIDQEVIAQWDELYSDKKINEVEVEALNGKTTRCKFKRIKKAKDIGKGVIKMPEKIQLTLEISSGELVTVKPVVQ